MGGQAQSVLARLVCRKATGKENKSAQLRELPGRCGHRPLQIFTKHSFMQSSWPEPLKFPGGKGQFSQFLLSLSLTFRQGACKISQVWCTLPGRKRPEGVSFLSGLAGVCVLRPMLAFCFFNSLGEPPSANCHAQFHMGISATPSAPILRRRCVFRLWNGI